jgi:P27 family predicted phage terminase small subunit
VRGRKPALAGTAEPVTEVPRAPSWLSKDAAAEWRRIMPQLIKRRILTDADMGSVENYCLAIGHVREMERIISREGHVTQTDKGPRKHPAVAIQADAMTRARLLAAELGLTPVSRSRPSVANDQPDSDLADLDI